MVRVLVCGSRTFADKALVEGILQGLVHRTDTLIEGGAKGADRLAWHWAFFHLDFDNVLRFPADWDLYGNRAGPIRNQGMLDSGVDLCVAFIDKPLEESKGTFDMVKRCRKAKVKTVVIQVS